MTEEIVRRLTPLKEFPGYYIDMEKHEVWSHLRRCTMKEATWHKLTIRKDKHPHFIVHIDGKPKNINLAKIILSITNGCSYFDIPSDTYIFNYNRDRSITIEERTEERLRWWKKRRQEINDNRIEDTRHNIHCLQLLLKAYEGNARPLLEYVNKRKQDFLRILTSEGYGYQKAKVGYDAAFDILIENLQNTTSRPYNFDGWYLKTMRGMIKKLYKKNCREVNPEHLPYFK